MCAPSLTHPTSLLHTSSPPSHSIQTLVKISKTAGARLKPHAPRLIPALLEALSTLEPAVLNYLSLRATEQEKVTPPWNHIWWAPMLARLQESHPPCPCAPSPECHGCGPAQRCQVLSYDGNH